MRDAESIVAGAGVMEPTVEGVMRRAPVTITPGETLSAAQALMEREGVRQLPVIEKGALAGILSERDLHAHIGYLERTKVNVAMTRDLVTVAPATTAQQAARLLIERKFNALPVVDGDRLIGIVSRTDLLRLLVDLLDQQKA